MRIVSPQKAPGGKVKPLGCSGSPMPETNGIEKEVITMEPSHFVAVDFGAETGRVMLATLADEHLELELIHRFPNHQVRMLGRLHWDVLELFRQFKIGLADIAQRGFRSLDGIAVDTWGVDYGLLDQDGTLLGYPVSYRDPRTDGQMERVFQDLSREEIYEITGIQFMQLNTLFQLVAAAETSPALLAAAGKLLFMPDLFNYLLTGMACSELTIASTSQLLDARKRSWADELFRRLELPRKIMPAIRPTGSILGPLLSEITEETGLETEVVLGSGHDTACAVLAVPAKGSDWAYLSSGTWSLLGVETSEPIITSESLSRNFTNEAGYGGTIRFLRNIMGMWLLQRCKTAWEAEDGREISYDDMVAAAAEAKPFAALFDPDDPSLLHPSDMPATIAELCQKSSRRTPQGRGGMVRAIFESLALKYRHVLTQLEEMRGSPIRVLHVVGGASRNPLLNQFTADATGMTVVAGPSEATAAGNALVQALAKGIVSSVADARALVARSFELQHYEPQSKESWDAAYEKARRFFG